MEQIITLKVDLFLPPCGDCTFALNSMPNWTMLLPPCGDGIEWKLKYIAAFKLSPPYGDCTTTAFDEVLEFSPPYGDCTLNISQNTAKLKSRMARKYSLYCNDVLLR